MIVQHVTTLISILQKLRYPICHPPYHPPIADFEKLVTPNLHDDQIFQYPPSPKENKVTPEKATKKKQKTKNKVINLRKTRSAMRKTLVKNTKHTPQLRL